MHAAYCQLLSTGEIIRVGIALYTNSTLLEGIPGPQRLMQKRQLRARVDVSGSFHVAMS